MTDLFGSPVEMGIGRSNGQAIGHITNAREMGLTRTATAQALRDRMARGELAGVSNRIVTMNLDFGR